ncbi:MAG: peptide-methionine (R)-S-oxide reductase [Acidobacteriota bacterium]
MRNFPATSPDSLAKSFKGSAAALLLAAVGLALFLASPTRSEAQDAAFERDREAAEREIAFPDPVAQAEISAAFERALERAKYSVKKVDAGLLDVGEEAFPGFRIRRSEDEWRRLLTPAQYAVTRAKLVPSETPASLPEEVGTFACTCGNPLFDSADRESTEAALASFRQPLVANSVATDLLSTWSREESKIELVCAMCGAHLGHVDPGQTPSDPLHYLVHPEALVFTADAAKK